MEVKHVQRIRCQPGVCAVRRRCRGDQPEARVNREDAPAPQLLLAEPKLRAHAAEAVMAHQPRPIEQRDLAVLNEPQQHRECARWQPVQSVYDGQTTCDAQCMLLFASVARSQFRATHR